MVKRFLWVFLAFLAVGASLWLVLAGGGQKGELAKAPAGVKKGRESSRHRTGEVEKHLASPLEKKVVEQQQLVEEHKKALSAFARARVPMVLNPNGAPPPDETSKEAAKRDQAAQDFEDARQDYNADRQLLEKLILELAEEQARGK